VEAIAAFDPHYHYVAFKSIAGVLSEEAGKIFKFKEQEKLHEEIIDKGLAKIYQDHLDRAAEMAKGEGVTIKTTLLTGKPYDQILKYVEKEKPALLVMGRAGVHAAAGLDIGSNTENCVRSASCNVLIVSREARPPAVKEEARKSIPWTAEAEELLNRIPPMARGMVRNMVEDQALKRGYTEVTADYIRKAREMMMSAK
jgi:nucleotide-binding universal stress UspA family protein